ERGLRLVNPELGSSTTLDTQGVPPEHIWMNWNGARDPFCRDSEDRDEGVIVLKTDEHAWLVLDEDATTVRRLDVPDSVVLQQRVGPNAAIVRDDWSSTGSALFRLDLVTGEMTMLFPVLPPDVDGSFRP